MPNAKRPLAELDSNASHASTMSDQVGDSSKAAEKGQRDPNRQKHVPSPDTINLSPGENREDISFEKKDNSRLRTLLSERNLSSSGSRDQMIAVLKSTSINYDILCSGQITTMLKGRGVSMSGQGRRTSK